MPKLSFPIEIEDGDSSLQQLSLVVQDETDMLNIICIKRPKQESFRKKILNSCGKVLKDSGELPSLEAIRSQVRLHV